MTRSTKTRGLLRRMPFGFRRRWAVVLVLPPVPGFELGLVRTVMRKDLTYLQARAQLGEVSDLGPVRKAIRDEGAELEVRALDRHGFIIVPETSDA